MLRPNVQYEFLASAIRKFMSHMTSSAYLPQLQTFVTAYRLGSLTRAAEALGMSQPAVSGHIRALEAWLGQPDTVGITAGASAPEVLVREVVEALGERFDVIEQENDHVPERMIFKLPRELVA